ncbi:FtsQ-type POTRA domain-containing protein [Deinococcus sp. SDU3-2]|uniref:FtsQ-type POTRA domain-containing protein n=1 Tax=Deinococcus terrestris TaxID=2651870 RepID=A0A7X1NUU7_9DEIO|nr:FtsQ-type POTRA domain-containing protein [Deinococcus terrestris]MPY66232.1 FtsQ-type POTRA domain-containing protein [Deinococcus terrestris]
MTDPDPRPTNRRVPAPKPAPDPVTTEPPASEPAVEDVPPPPPPRRPLNLRPLWWTLGSAAVLGVLAASWFLLPIRTVTVQGHERLSEAQVRRLAGLTPEFGWLYYGRWRAGGLARSPWIEAATVTRRFPDTVVVRVREREPFARWKRPGGEIVTLAEDGTVLPGARNVAGLPLISGWGPDRRAEALALTRALRRYNVQSVAYTPSGFTAATPTTTAWSGDLATLLKYAGAIVQFPDQEIHIYPWGVSVQ